MTPPVDEIALMGAVRGEAVPVVKCVTSDIRVPADAEMVLEGYIDDGYSEAEGPYGEFLGYYGVMKKNPVFHLTAITHRKDPLFQTSTISGEHIGWTDSTQLNAIRAEVTIWRALQTAVREPVAVYVTASSGGIYNLPLSMRTFFKTIGATRTGGGASMASYLLFEAAFCNELMQAGYADTMAREVEIMAFLDFNRPTVSLAAVNDR